MTTMATYIDPQGNKSTMTAEAAMRAYQACGFKGQIIPVAAQESTASGTTTGTEGEVSAVAVKRIESADAHLDAHGLLPDGPIYAPGTRVVEMGHDNFRESRQATEDMGSLLDNMRAAYRVIRAEDRRDATVPLTEVVMHDDGRIDWGEGAVALERNGLRGLVARSDVLPRGFALMEALEPDVRAHVWNRQIKRQEPKALSLRVRTLNGGKEYGVYAATSSRYAAFDADKMLTVVGRALNAGKIDMHGRVRYNPATTSLMIDGFMHMDEVVDLAAGDVFKLGMQFRSNDAAGGAITGGVTAWRNQCLNLLIISQAQRELLRKRHIGTMDAMVGDVRASVTQAGTIFAPFAAQWGYLRQTDVRTALGVEENTTMHRVMEIVASKLDVGIKRDAVVEALLASYANEPGESAADIVNAVTGVHLLEDINAWQLERFEQAAGQLVPVLAKRA